MGQTIQFRNTEKKIIQILQVLRMHNYVNAQDIQERQFLQMIMLRKQQ